MSQYSLANQPTQSYPLPRGIQITSMLLLHSIVATGFLVTTVVFLLEPRFDLEVSALFYRIGAGFPFSNSMLAKLVYDGTRWVSAAIIIGLMLGYPVCAFGLRKRSASWRSLLAYLLLALLIGPGLIVDFALKDHWGRARPHDIVEFGGNRSYTPPLQPAQECPSNCSFGSGHASAGFFLIAPAFFYAGRRRRIWLAMGLGAGCLIGFVRMMQGGHFLSDVLFTFFAVWVGCTLARWLVLRHYHCTESLEARLQQEVSACPGSLERTLTESTTPSKH